MKALKLTTLVILCALATGAIAQSDDMPQQDGKGKERIKAMKIGFITNRLNLSPEEAKTFWPVYNSFQNEMEDVRKNHRIEKKENNDDLMNMSDKDAEKLVDDEIGFRQKELDVIKKYHGQFKQVLPAKKIAMLYRTEQDFKKELIERIKEKREEKREFRRQPGGR
jgi:hypothetical protein